MLERKHYQIHIWKRCHLAYQTGTSIYKICGGETEKPIPSNCWQQGKLTEPVQWNGDWLSNGQCVHSLIHTGEALRKCVLKSYFHMSKIISRIFVVPLFIMSCQTKQQMFKVRVVTLAARNYTSGLWRRENETHCNIPHQICFQWNEKWEKGMRKNTLHSVRRVLNPK